MSDTPKSIAAQRVASYFRRWSELEDRKQDVADDAKELMAEAKGNGFDTKAMRAVFRDKRAEQNGDAAKREEQQVIYDLYWSALDSALSKPRAHPAPARVESIEQFDVETGEITEQPETASQSEGRDHSGGANEYAGTSSDENPAPISNPQPTSSPEADKAETVNHLPVSAPIPDDDFTPPAFIAKDRAERNERCEKPLACQFGHHPQKVTCSTCTTAWQIARRKAVAA